MSTEMLAAELRKTSQVLTKAQHQLHEERQISAMRAEEAEAQLALATEQGRQEERQSAQMMVAEARGTLSALVDVHEKGAAYVKQNERGVIAAALAEQRRGLEAEIRESKLAIEIEQADLRHAAEERHRHDMLEMRKEVEAAKYTLNEAEERASTYARKLEATREGRVEFLYQKALRKIFHAQLAKGWNSLKAKYDEVLYARVLIRTSGGRFFNLIPTVRSAFGKWTNLKGDLEHAAKLKAEAKVVQEEKERQNLVAELEAELDAVRRNLEQRLQTVEDENIILKKKIADDHAAREEFNLLVEARADEERLKRISIIQREAGFRVGNHLLARGWATWGGQYKRYRDDQRKAKIFREAQMRLFKPNIAKPFIHWRSRWQQTASKNKQTAEEALEEKLATSERLQHAAEQEAARVRNLLVEKDQALSLANVALDDERRALVHARAEAAEAVTMSLQARDFTSKAAAAEVKSKQLQLRLDESAEALERERAEAKKAGDQQRQAAEKDLKRLLTEQRQSLEVQMAQALKEAEERIKMIEERCRRELDAMRQQQLQIEEERRTRMEEERRESRAASPPPTDDVQVQYRRSGLHPIWPKGPELNTADRALAWEQWQQARDEQQRQPPQVAWSQAMQSADAFRAARKFPVAIPNPGSARGNQTSARSNQASARGRSQSIAGGQRFPTPGLLRTSSSAGILTAGVSIEQISAPRSAVTIIPAQSNGSPTAD